MFGIVLVVNAAFFLTQLNDSDSSYTMRIMYLYVTEFIHLPAILLLIILSISTCFTKKPFWSLLKIEYYFLFASLTPFVIGWFMYVVVPYLK